MQRLPTFASTDDSYAPKANHSCLLSLSLLSLLSLSVSPLFLAPSCVTSDLMLLPPPSIRRVAAGRTSTTLSGDARHIPPAQTRA